MAFQFDCTLPDLNTWDSNTHYFNIGTINFYAKLAGGNYITFANIPNGNLPQISIPYSAGQIASIFVDPTNAYFSLNGVIHASTTTFQSLSITSADNLQVSAVSQPVSPITFTRMTIYTTSSGSKVLYGSGGPPASSTPTIGSFYIDTSTGKFYIFL
jgi:hypothetical protein